MGTEMTTFEQDDFGVTATLKVGEREEKIVSKFLIGCDGAKGTFMFVCTLFDPDLYVHRDHA